MRVMHLRILTLMLKRYEIALTLLPHPTRHLLSVGLGSSGGRGLHFRLAAGCCALSGGYRTPAGTYLGWIGRSGIRVRHYLR